MNLTSHQLHILRHSLGLDDNGRGNQYRNHYVAGLGHHSWDALQQLVAQGLMAQRGVSSFLTAGDRVFTVTPTGKAAAVAGVKRRHVSRGRRRYQNWRELAEVLPDLTFRQFLTHPDFAEHRT